MFLSQMPLRQFRQRIFRIPRLSNYSTSSMAKKPEDADRHLFEYTSGRWIYNESLRLAERSLPFNVPNLKRAVADSVDRPETDIKSFDKLAEGGFNRVFEAIFKDGTQVLARLPYASTVPKRLTVASEVATLDLVRSHDVPVPKVLDYSIDSENPVGAEYIIMEKVHGKPIGDSWYTLSEKERLKFLMELVQIEAKLFAINLPASGGIYYSHDLPPETERAMVPLPKGSDLVAPRGEICVGPEPAVRWWYRERALLRDINRGPHFDAMDSLTAAAKKELAWLKSYGKPRLPFEREYRDDVNYQKSSPEEHMASIDKYLEVAPYLIPQNKNLHVPVLRHPDIQPHNIFVSENFDIVGLIDWQHCSALPLFLATGVPTYIQNYNDQESLNFTPPKLPDNLDEMSDDDRSTALEEFRRRQLHFYYLEFSKRFNPAHFHALRHDASHFMKRKTFTHAGDPWEGNNIPLKADLMHLVKDWDNLATRKDAEDGSGANATVPPCPISFDSSETEETLRIEEEREETDSQLNYIRAAMEVGTDGWTPNESYEDATTRAKEWKKAALESMSDNKEEQEMAEKHWPFDDFDENE